MAFALLVFSIGAYVNSSRTSIYGGLRFIGVPIPREWTLPQGVGVVQTAIPFPAQVKNQVSVLKETIMAGYTPTWPAYEKTLVSVALRPTITPVPSATCTQTDTPTPFARMPTFPANYVLPGAGLGGKMTGCVDQMIKISWYWPPLGGINCDRQAGQQECAHIADGELVADVVGQVAACPDGYDGMYVGILGFTFRCADKGGAIVKNGDGSIWVDMLYPYNPIKGLHWSEEVKGEICNGWEEKPG